jgi:hypothetical protein
MAETETVVRKVYTSAFVIDRAKLSRMLGIIVERFTERGLTINMAFDIQTRNGRRFELHSSDDLFRMDNPVRNPIVSLEIGTRADVVMEVSESAPTDVPYASVRFDSDKHDNVSLLVASADTTWASRLFGELEEQVERALAPTWMHRIRKIEIITLLLMLVISFLMFASILRLSNIGVESTAFSPSVVQQLSTQASHADTPNEQLQFIFEVQRRAVLRDNEASAQLKSIFWPFASFGLRSMLLALPVLLVAGSFVYMIVYLYPWAVFNWGDFEEHYRSLVGRRRGVWTLVIFALIVGIIGNLFVLGLSGILPS